MLNPWQEDAEHHVSRHYFSAERSGLAKSISERHFIYYRFGQISVNVGMVQTRTAKKTAARYDTARLDVGYWIEPDAKWNSTR